MASKKKLRAKIKELEYHIQTLIDSPESGEAILIKLCHQTKAKMEKAIWSGSVDIKLADPQALKNN